MRAPLLLFALGLLAGCSIFDPARGGPQACTMEFRTYTVRVVDAAGEPVEGLTTTVRNERTGEVLAFDDGSIFPENGTYLVATDGHTFRRGGDPVSFHAEGDGLTASASFEFAFDGCHVVKESGPEQIVAVPE